MDIKKIALGARILLGLIFFVFGLNGFFQFTPMPKPTPEGGAFLGALMTTGYFFPVLKITETVSGLLLLSGYYVPLGLLFLAPVITQIFLYHAFLDPSGLPLAVVVVLLEAFLGYVYRASYSGVLTAKTTL